MNAATRLPATVHAKCVLLALIRLPGVRVDQPTCYEVYRTATGWHARLDGLDEPILFISREHALKIARAAALDRWQLEGCPSRVTVAEQDGRIVQDVSYDESYSGESLDESDPDEPELRGTDAIPSAASSATKLSLHAVAAMA